ncbi:putative glyoxalase superfamily protein PhnB [Nocardioides albertanoniae]|uniref:Putative glyoxalase superfamily protein PhnB n=1 Tax=Nocardioides albertanoniae TaxID=1175486 RepID=A0A543A7Z7_9ACTN|nr:VOC family protein [Nocardioides albertanoniae]TQL68718.1 putative glyoxalase superfamily protein PhnB [Nocardioides albertanoniae]
MDEAGKIKYWQSMAFRDAEAMMTWLSAIGFVEHATYRDAGVVVHAEWLWPAGGGLMFGQAREGGGIKSTGGSSAYLVAEDPDAVFDKAVAAGARVERAMVDQDYGGRGGTVTDPEGNSWSFGSYQPS